MTTRETLEKARALISDESHWGQRRWQSLMHDGSMVYCAIGALQRAAGFGFAQSHAELCDHDYGVTKAASALASVIGKESRVSVQNYNDNNSHECVLAMYDRAIEVEKEKETK